ncbi:MAG: molybdopterin cofactor-binding domain-containing protein [Pseudomonadota bacterium]
MSRARTIARRSFLIGSVAIAGGVAFGAYAINREIPNPLLEDLAEGEAAITPYVKVDASGVTLIAPRADKGQGAYSIQAYLIAEELDIDPHSAQISPGLPGPAYYNGTVLGEGVPFPGYDNSETAERMRAFMSVPAKLFQIQMTGGSSTVPDAFVRLRMAGAIARETLKEAAARRIGGSRYDLRTEDGHVILPSGDKISYAELATDAAQITPVQDVSLRDKSEWRFLGKAEMQRTDMVSKCTGSEIYGIDMSMEDMVFATVRANPGIGGEVAHYDAADAGNMRGVQKILPVAHGVAVVADNTWRAFQAADALEITWADPDYPATSAEIFDVLEKVLNSDAAFDHRQRNEGDVDTALAGASEIIEASYRLPYLAHAPLEPMNATVKLSADKVEIWTGTQIPLFIRDRAASIAGVEKDAVKVYVLPMGGSFGHRLEMTHVEQAVEIAMALPGTPVKMTWSREEDMTHDYPRPAAVAKCRGVVENGKVDTFDLSVAQSAMAPEWFGRLTGMSIPGPDRTITTGSWDQPFAIPNYRVTGYRAPPMVPVSSWRSVGASGNGFLHECFLDELIHAAGADPLEERLRLCHDMPSRKVLEAVGDMSGWDGPMIAEGRGRGIGFTHSFGVPCAHVIEVSQSERGIRIDKVFTSIDSGLVLDPTNYHAQVTGGVIWALGHAMNCELTYVDFAPTQDNYYAYEGMRMYQTPDIEVRTLENNNRVKGVGEPPVPPAAPALANAIFSATGQRIRQLPLYMHVDFV